MNGRDLSPEARKAIDSYSDDLLEALIDAVCLETRSHGKHRIREEDVLKSVKTISLFPARVVPRATLKIFNQKALPGRPVVPYTTSSNASQVKQPTKKPGQPLVRPRRAVVDEAQFLEDIRKMKPLDTREPVVYSSHKLLDAKDIRPLLGASAVAEASSALERPARHFVGRPQPLITEDRGNLQPELTLYQRYREYLGVIGPMPNIKSKFGPMNDIPAYLNALRHRNEILGLVLRNGTGLPDVPQVHPPSLPIQRPIQIAPMQTYYEQPVHHQQQALNFPVQNLPNFPLLPPPNVPMPFDFQRAVQSLHPHQAARIFHEFLQRHRREKWVDDLERSALESPTPPLSECAYPLCSVGDHHHCVSSRKSADLTLSLTVRDDDVGPGTPPCTRVDTPPEQDVIELSDMPVDHIDCAEYYTRVNKDLDKKSRGSQQNSSSEALKNRELDLRNNVDLVAGNTDNINEIVIPKPPAYLSPKEAQMFERLVGRMVLIARGGRVSKP